MGLVSQLWPSEASQLHNNIAADAGRAVWHGGT
jgi:hypothetical protein